MRKPGTVLALQRLTRISSVVFMSHLCFAIYDERKAAGCIGISIRKYYQLSRCCIFSCQLWRVLPQKCAISRAPCSDFPARSYIHVSLPPLVTHRASNNALPKVKWETWRPDSCGGD